jgi:CheY-like chemotaxis protein
MGMVPQQANVLLVDDSENDRLLFKIAMKHSNVRRFHLLKPLANGAEAIAYLSGAGPYHDRTAFPYPDLLVLDLKMPFKNGFDVLEFLRNQSSSAGVIIISDSNAKSDQDRALALGAIDYYLKPDGLPGLVELCERIETTLSEGAFKRRSKRVSGHPRRQYVQPAR